MHRANHVFPVEVVADFDVGKAFGLHYAALAGQCICDGGEQATKQDAPLGVFDSGLGGLTVVRALREKTVYDKVELVSGRMAKISKGDVIAGVISGRLGDEITVFDSTGLAVQDVAVARAIYDLARERGTFLSVPLTA